jgi:hypothetical protein
MREQHLSRVLKDEQKFNREEGKESHFRVSKFKNWVEVQHGSIRM